MAASRRELGATEKNWCLALDGGTGITVSAFLFGQPFSKATIQAAVNKLVSSQPLLNSQIVSSGNSLFIELSEKTIVVEEISNPFSDQGSEKSAGDEDAAEEWLKIVELELNRMFPNTKPSPVFQARLYSGLQDDSSLVIFRAQSSAIDMTSTGPIALEFLNVLIDMVQTGNSSVEELLKMVKLEESISGKFEFQNSVENGIPKGSANKSIWAHGTDVLGYGILAKKQAYLPFKDTEGQRKSRIIRAALSKDSTDRLLTVCKTLLTASYICDTVGTIRCYCGDPNRIPSVSIVAEDGYTVNSDSKTKSVLVTQLRGFIPQVCKSKATDLCGALSAAGLKSVAKFKNVGKKGEPYLYMVLHDCRAELDPRLSEDSVGCFQSALLKSTQATQDDDYWKLAAKCTSEVEKSITSKKHFTDMGNLNMLMLQAIQRPKLTPSGSLRTSMCSIFHEPIIETVPEMASEVLKLKEFVSASSAHGIGPCLGIFPFLRHGALHLSFVFCSPLFQRKDIQAIVDSIVSHISLYT